MEAKDLEREYLNGNPRVERFDNMANFMLFCYINKLTEDNSITWYKVKVWHRYCLLS